MFSELYFYRWPVETKYREFKSRLAIEEFSEYRQEISGDIKKRTFDCGIMEEVSVDVYYKV